MNIHYDCPHEPLFSKTIDLLGMFDLSQCVRDPSHVRGHIIDWLVCRTDDSVVQSTTMTSAIATDHSCVMATLDASVPHTPPVSVTVRNLRAIDRPAFCVDVNDELSVFPSVAAGNLDRALRDVLKVHTPAMQSPPLSL